MLKKNKIIVICLLAVFLLAGGLFLYVNKKNIRNKDLNSVNKENIEKSKRAEELDSLNGILKETRLTDADLDGLSNEEENGLGTDPQKADTDGDGILDNDEITIYKTNPLKADTDGDGKSDGYEARRNQDPLKK